MHRIGCILALAVFTASHTLKAEDLILPRDEEALNDALSLMGMTSHDFGFDKDVAEPDWYFDWSKTWLEKPREATQAAQSLLNELETTGSPIKFFAETLEQNSEPSSATNHPPEINLPETYESLLRSFMDGAVECTAQLNHAFAQVPAAGRRRLACSLLAGLFAADESETVRTELQLAGFSGNELNRWIEAQKGIDPAPEGRWNLTTGDAVDLHDILSAFERMEKELNALRARALSFRDWPNEKEMISTSLGRIMIGSTSADLYTEAYLLILDPGGDDRYQGKAGSANSLEMQLISTIVDLSGNDRYRGEHLLAPGSALFGLSAILDEAGDDLYEGKWIGAGAGLFGAAGLYDRAGNDTYRAQGFGQAAGHVGIGFLEDHAGNDIYDIGFAGQGFAGFKGVGLLVDRSGNDLYKAGGVRPDYERHDDRFLSMAQGFAIGVRPWAGGGRGVLVDLEGDDRYIADVYGQGVGYWYSAGMLLDLEGNDQYSMFQYGQGTGIHLSLGLLADLKGRDQYTGYVLTQGSAHDYAVGILIEGEGDDTYVADHYSQGRAMNNSLAILLDREGRDGYFSRQCDRSQGIGNNADLRDYGSLALILDLAGEDQYSCGAQDNESQFRPDFGQIYDREVSHEE